MQRACEKRAVYSILTVEHTGKKRVVVWKVGVETS
jgi:hypothetical protein